MGKTEISAPFNFLLFFTMFSTRVNLYAFGAEPDKITGVRELSQTDNLLSSERRYNLDSDEQVGTSEINESRTHTKRWLTQLAGTLKYAHNDK